MPAKARRVETSEKETAELMPASLDKHLQFSESLRNEVKRRYPGMDPDWAVNRYLEKILSNSVQTANVLAPWMPEIVRSHEAMEREHAKSKAR